MPRFIRVVLAFALVAAALDCGLSRSHPSDAALERVFFEKRGTFERLAKMAEEDRKVVRIAHDFTWLEDTVAWPRPNSKIGFSVERWDEYRTIFRELGLSAGTARNKDYPGILFLIASAEGMVTGGSDKGYAFSPVPLLTQQQSLDGLPPGSRSGVPSFKHLDGNWYLYFRWDD